MITFDFRDVLYLAGIGEDGDEVYGRSISVMVRTPSGRQFVHDHAFVTNKGPVTYDEEDGYWVGFDTRDPREVEAEAEALRARIESHYRRGGKLDPAHWNETDPAYGSEAYCFYDRQGVWLARERQQDRDNGEHVPEDFRLDGPLELFTELPELNVSSL